MRLSVSNIAWPADADDRVGNLMAGLGFEGLEVAPTRVWPTPLSVSEEEITRFRLRWERKGIRVVAMQALLFGRPDLTIFQSPAKREETLKYLQSMIRLGDALGAEVLVFGSPRNRSIVGVDPEDAELIARSFFGALGDYAMQRGVYFCIEPNPSDYGCDFVTDLATAETLVESVASPGFGLHVDAGGMSLTGEPIEETVRRVGRKARHVHVSEAHLAPVGTGSVDHRRMGAALAAARYKRWLSIEMRMPEGEDWFGQVEAALRHTVECYSEVASA